MESRVFVSSTMDFKSRLRSWCIDLRVKDALQHAGLLFTLMAYTVMGGVVSKFFVKFIFGAK